MRPFLLEQHVEFFGNLTILYIGVASPSRYPVALAVSGQPGFIKAVSPTLMTVQPMQALQPGGRLLRTSLPQHSLRKQHCLDSMAIATSASFNRLLKSVARCPLVHAYALQEKFVMVRQGGSRLSWIDFVSTAACTFKIFGNGTL